MRELRLSKTVQLSRAGRETRPARAIDGRMHRLAALFLLVLALAAPADAQGPFSTSPYQPPADDKTGTNPLNLQQQIDVANVYVELGELYLNTTTYQHTLPLLHRRVALSGSVPFSFSNASGATDRGLGDVGASVEWTPWLFSKGGMVAGLSTTWDTASADVLGLGVNTLMPYGQFVVQPSPRTLVAPFVTYRVGVGGDEFAPAIKDTLVGVSVVWRSSDRLWLSARPQVIFDSALDSTYGEVGGEVGVMVSRRVSTYVRPSFGYGRNGAKPYDWALTAGLRFVP
jgi:hypothetical protein